jgi:hypothetical protein
MELQFKIKETGKESVLVRAALVDIVAWEDRFERPSSTMGGDSIFARDFVWLAWHSQKRTGATTLDFMDWVATLDEIEGAEETTLVPLESSQATGSSPALPSKQE